MRAVRTDDTGTSIQIELLAIGGNRSQGFVFRIRSKMLTTKLLLNYHTYVHSDRRNEYRRDLELDLSKQVEQKANRNHLLCANVSVGQVVTQAPSDRLRVELMIEKRYGRQRVNAKDGQYAETVLTRK